MTPQEAKAELEEEFETFKSGIDPADWENPNEELKKIIEANTMAIEVLGQTRWIPVSERLPEDFGGDYLINIAYRGTYVGTDLANYVPCGYLDGLWDTPNDWIEGPSDLWHVTAWMPLPQPYKADNKEVEE